MSACADSCVGGLVMEKYHRSPVQDYLSVARFAGEKDFEVDQPDLLELRKRFVPIAHRAALPTESELTDILRQMGKYKRTMWRKTASMRTGAAAGTGLP